MANPKNSYSTHPKPENLHVFVETDDRRKVQPIESPGEIILDVRAQILKSFVFLTINSGFILVEADFTWDSRELAYYHIKSQLTIYMKLILKGGGCKS